MSSSTTTGTTSTNSVWNDVGADFEIPEALESMCRLEELGWNASFWEKALWGYRQFMKLKLQEQDWSGTKLVPPWAVDQVWRQHLLFPVLYAQACKNYSFGRVMDYDSSSSSRERESNTLRKCTALFGPDNVDLDIWSFPNCSTTGTTCSTTGRKRKRCDQAETDNNDEDDNETVSFEIQYCRLEQVPSMTFYKVPQDSTPFLHAFAAFRRTVAFAGPHIISSSTGSALQPLEFYYQDKLIIHDGNQTPRQIGMHPMMDQEVHTIVAKKPLSAEDNDTSSQQQQVDI
ncbi:expressed unknown protein [Seminavis robusta]|uniref:Uncharacterized protein n=1 Tax=Seminavis robusta TaxID=568900 RepID=A0A9N8HRK3_9STRA|nr:expressed unknown protein [Seminavis robusta]|eukprot:Sro1282_g258990.1 n/a (287) ;mRNA; f:14207-15067